MSNNQLFTHQIYAKVLQDIDVPHDIYNVFTDDITQNIDSLLATYADDCRFHHQSSKSRIMQIKFMRELNIGELKLI